MSLSCRAELSARIHRPPVPEKMQPVPPSSSSISSAMSPSYHGHYTDWLWCVFIWLTPAVPRYFSHNKTLHRLVPEEG
jgi:hypothetical protein